MRILKSGMGAVVKREVRRRGEDGREPVSGSWPES